MSFSSKYARSVEWFYFDFASQLPAGDTVTVLEEIVQEAGDCVLDSPGIVGALASVRLSAGTTGNTIILRALASTSGGETLEVRDMFLVI